MKLSRQLFTCFVVACLFLPACAPDCEHNDFLEVDIQPAYRRPGEEVIVKTIPSDFLRNREIYMQRSKSNRADPEMIQSDYHAAEGGRIVQLDPDIVDVGNQLLYIKDEDCGGYISLKSVRVVDEGFENTNPGLFVAPAPPIVIIPSPPIPAPTNIVNTWFSPDDPKYCIWFDPKVDTIRDQTTGQITCIQEKTELRPGNIAKGTGARELRCQGTADDYDHDNPITGFIDQLTGQVNFTIDRSAKGLGSEQYIGHIVDPKTLPASYQVSGRCVADNSLAQTTMVVTSQKTGRKLVMYRHKPNNFDDSLLCKP